MIARENRPAMTRVAQLAVDTQVAERALMDAVHAKASAEARLRTLQRAGDTRGAARCREEIAAAQATITASNLRAEEIRREIQSTDASALAAVNVQTYKDIEAATTNAVHEATLILAPVADLEAALERARTAKRQADSVWQRSGLIPPRDDLEAALASIGRAITSMREAASVSTVAHAYSTERIRHARIYLKIEDTQK
jgi:hypothetical protein